MSNEMKWAIDRLAIAMRGYQQEVSAEQKWEAWKKVTWESRRFNVKANNLKHRMRCL